MNLVLDNWIVTSYGKISKSDLERILTRSPALVEIGRESYWEEIYLFSVKLVDGSPKFYVAIYLDNPGFPPTIVSHYNDNHLLIFYSNRLVVFDLYEGRIYFEYISESIVYFTKFYMDTIVLVSELSITQLKRNGDVIIVHTLDDVLEEFKFEQGSIICRTLSSCTEYLLASGMQHLKVI